jgi:hypothetical protein
MSVHAAMVAVARAAAVAIGLVAAAGCAARSRPVAARGGPQCQFVVHNQTNAPIEVRLATTSMSSVAIGMLGGGELMHHAVPCAQGHVLVLGVEIPWVVGARPRFGVIYREAELVEGARVRVPLHFP